MRYVIALLGFLNTLYAIITSRVMVFHFGRREGENPENYGKREPVGMYILNVQDRVGHST
jgi:hypothetical protein